MAPHKKRRASEGVPSNGLEKRPRRSIGRVGDGKISTDFRVSETSKKTPIPSGVEGNGRQAGFLVSEALSRLLKECSVTLATTIGKSNTQHSSKSTASPLHDVQARPLRVLVYGLLSEKDTVTKISDEGSLFLQRPGACGYDRRIKYFNPMYLLRPGEDMPSASGFHGAGDRGEAGGLAEENEVVRSMALRIFDEAEGSNSGTLSSLKQSSRITSKLKSIHQLEALSMIVKREDGPLNGNWVFPCLWEMLLEGGRTNALICSHGYRHVVTKSIQSLPLLVLHGGILADEMGLGKTLSTIALICHHLDIISRLAATQLSSVPRASLIVTPKSKIRSFVYHGPKRRDASKELYNFDVVLTTYDTLRSDWKARVILDEAHKIRNRSSDIFHATCEIRAENRWCLTGTPIHNSLDDYGSLLAFIGVPPFTTTDQFKFWISSLIDSKSRGYSLETLRKLVCATCLRRTRSTPHLSATLKLTNKTERVEVVELGPKEREVYEFFKRRATNKHTVAAEATPQRSAGNIIVLISVLRMICNHAEASVSWVLLRKVAQEDRMCCPHTEVIEFPCAKHVACEACVVSIEDATTTGSACPKCSPINKASPSGVATSPPPFSPSSKISALVRNVLSTLQVDESGNKASPPTKSIIFSQWTGMLDLISNVMSTQLSPLGFSFVRIDGNSALQQRRSALDKFNSNSNCVIMLATIGAVSEGIDLSIASETHIVEPHWNPMAEAQAADRVHRIGQTRDVKITRYCVKDSVEEVQNKKLKLISQSLSSADHREEALVEKR
ncbi:hypothetical protein GGR58DRAFT_510699 [Xylaria digitata]|nr:hypothetical protein GGR58DRAFT_510699 [Xylaria digitata]